MELKGFLESTLMDMEKRLNTALEGLTPQEVAWQPVPECNSIGFILWHTIRVEDFFFQHFIQHQPELYESEGWQQKLGTPPKDTGYQYTLEQMNGFRVPVLETLKAYGKAVRHHTLEFLRQLPTERLGEIPQSRRPDLSIGGAIQLFLAELTLHIGQIAYLRGMQRGIDK